jgi:hypothetical protein
MGSGLQKLKEIIEVFALDPIKHGGSPDVHLRSGQGKCGRVFPRYATEIFNQALLAGIDQKLNLCLADWRHCLVCFY